MLALAGRFLDVDLAQVLKRESQLIAHLVANVAPDAYATRLSETIHSRGYVHPVAVNVVALDDDVANADAHAIGNPPAFGNTGVAPSHLTLHIDGEVDSVHNAAELHEGAVAHQLDDPTAKIVALGLNHFLALGLELSERTSLVSSHEAAVTDNVGSEDGGQPALYALFAHGKPPLES